MNENPDQSLGGDDPAPQPAIEHPAHDHHNGVVVPPSLAAAAVRPLSIEEILEHGRRVERTAEICIRGDLYAEYDRLVAELSEMVSANGEVIIDASLGDTSDQVAAAHAKNAEVEAVRAQMQEWKRYVRFRQMPSDEWPGWDKAHRPTGKAADMTGYHTAIIAECAVEPKLSEDDVRALAKKIGRPQFMVLANTAFEANARGGVDIPKSLSSLLPQQED
jgi:hypothetical protein